MAQISVDGQVISETEIIPSAKTPPMFVSRLLSTSAKEKISEHSMEENNTDITLNLPSTDYSILRG